MKQLNNETGFTMVELLVVILTIAVLAGVVLINYPAAQKKFALQRAANKLALDIRRAQEMAIASEECEKCPVPFQDTVPKTGYGVYLEESDSEHYFFYADTTENKFYNPNELIETVEIEKGIHIYAIPGSPPDRASINFSPPDPEVSLKWVSMGGGQDSITIILCTDNVQAVCGPEAAPNPANTKKVFVNKAGLIAVY